MLGISLKVGIGSSFFFSKVSTVSGAYYLIYRFMNEGNI